MKIFRAIRRGATLLLGMCLATALVSCGSGAVSSDSDPTIAFAISPSSVTAYSGVPTTFNITGGGLRVPFLIVSSNAGALPVPISPVSSTQFTLTPNAVSAPTGTPPVPVTVTITVSDQAGKTATTNVTVLPNLINGDITVTGNAPPSFANCATAGAVCAGQSGTATLTVSQNGVPAKGRSVRFDVVQGNFQFPIDVGQTVFANSITVTSDESGRATTTLRATAGSSPQIATIRATDVATGAFRTATFLIKQPTINGGEFVTVPTEWKVNGAFKTICPAGSTDFLIFGGTAPYSIRSSAPGTAPVTPSTTANENPSRFSTTYPQLSCGVDGYQVVFTVTDSAGLSILATLTVKPGTDDVPASPSITLSPNTITLSCGQSAQVLATLTGFGTTAPTITTSVGTQTCQASALLVPPPVNGVITLTRGAGAIGTGGTCPAAAADPTPVAAAVIVGAGSAPSQTITVNTQRNCP